MKQLDQAFHNMAKEYERNLKDVYPARDSTGFTERNLVHTFVTSLYEQLEDEQAFSWLEFPWEDKKQHIDAFVYSPKKKSVFYIEAKRFSSGQQKNSLGKDIKRVIGTERNGILQEHGIYNIRNEYMVVLADVWLETKWKKMVPDWWTDGNIPQQVREWEKQSGQKLESRKSSFAEYLSKEKCIPWEKSNHSVYWLGANAAKLINYCLLFGYKKI